MEKDDRTMEEKYKDALDWLVQKDISDTEELLKYFDEIIKAVNAFRLLIENQ